ncbi:MAG: esterase family protein [Ruminococcaceae bacterium]|nr:esterase family protein [Oscillospiraceae bacterium]
MALITLRFESASLGKNTTVNIVRPDGNLNGVLYLLHGLSDDESIFLRRSSIERYAEREKLMVVMPNGDRCFYTDTPGCGHYFSFITEELPCVLQNTFANFPTNREKTYIGGISMGGYGSLKAALRCPEKYSSVLCLSGAFDICGMAENAFLGGKIWWQSILGDISKVRGSDEDVFALAEKRKAEGASLPRITMWCGESDFILDHSRRMQKHLNDLGYDISYTESPGSHCWDSWDEALPKLLPQIPN